MEACWRRCHKSESRPNEQDLDSFPVSSISKSRIPLSYKTIRFTLKYPSDSRHAHSIMVISQRLSLLMHFLLQ
ncbi:MAG: microviridin/marinostatin family tricyclic proteinase inhibitor [Candidatus Omnitrophica bacterium]|nr:microviridin/marinostatin family tricyclic proteinase inhibitor [Candidatus Omnitrophota bacterium]